MKKQRIFIAALLLCLSLLTAVPMTWADGTDPTSPTAPTEEFVPQEPQPTDDGAKPDVNDPQREEVND